MLMTYLYVIFAGFAREDCKKQHIAYVAGLFIVAQRSPIGDSESAFLILCRFAFMPMYPVVRRIAINFRGLRRFGPASTNMRSTLNSVLKM